MLEPGSVVTSPRGTVVEILENEPGRFAIRRTLPPGTGRTLPHRHDNGIERFTVLEGEATGSVGRAKRTLRAGDVLDVPVGATHTHPRPSKAGRAVVEHVIEPRPRFVSVYFASWLSWMPDGRLDGQDEPPFLGIMAIIAEGGGGSWVAGVPVAAQRALASALAPIAARRGLRAVVPTTF